MRNLPRDARTGAAASEQLLARAQKLSENFKASPVSISFHDADQDGLMDLVILIAYEKIKILRQVADKDFEEIDVAPPGGSSDQPWLARADVDGDGSERDKPAAERSGRTGWSGLGGACRC